MITRKEYLDNSNTLHRAYYAQMVTEQHKRLVIQKFGMNNLLKSKDPYLNDLPLHSWDMIANFARFDNLSNYGENNSISAKVCILKEAAKQIIEEHTLANTTP